MKGKFWQLVRLTIDLCLFTYTVVDFIKGRYCDMRLKKMTPGHLSRPKAKYH